MLADLRGAPPGRDDLPQGARLAGVLRRRALPPARSRRASTSGRSSRGWRTTGRATSFAAWQEGRTGFPIVDAGMRQLRATGWMHNRVRMIVASFLVKDLHVEWQHGARHFMQLAGRRRPRLQPARLAVDGGLRHRRGAVLPGLQPDHAGPQVRPGRRLRPHVGARAARRRRPARARRPDRRPCRGAPRGARQVREDQAMNDLLVPARFCGPPISGNGGWTAGAMAELVHGHPDDHAVALAGRHGHPPPSAPAGHTRAHDRDRRGDDGGRRRRHGRPGGAGRAGAHRGRVGPTPPRRARPRRRTPAGSRTRSRPASRAVPTARRATGCGSSPVRSTSSTARPGSPPRGPRTRAPRRTGTPTRTTTGGPRSPSPGPPSTAPAAGPPTSRTTRPSSAG